MNVYTGSTLAGLSSEGATTGGCNGPGAKVTLNLTGGTEYMIAVDNFGSNGPFSLHIRQPNPPANDDFANAETIPSAIPSSTPGTTADATAQPGELVHLGNNPAPATSSVWFEWTPDASGTYLIRTCQPGPGSNAIGVYTGSAVNTLTRVNGNSNGCNSGLGAQTTVDLTGGTTYSIAVDQSQFSGGSAGPFNLRISDLGGNTAPECPQGDLFVPVNLTLTVVGNCADADGDPISYGCCSPPPNGTYTLIFSPPSLRYTAGPNPGTDSSATARPTASIPRSASSCRSRSFRTSSGSTRARRRRRWRSRSPPPSRRRDRGRSPSTPARSRESRRPVTDTFLTQEFDITAPPASGPSNPLRLTFKIDASQVPAEEIVVFRNGVAVQDCTGAPGVAAPDPCLVEPDPRVPGQDVELDGPLDPRERLEPRRQSGAAGR